jgi:hypothetical protein
MDAHELSYVDLEDYALGTLGRAERTRVEDHLEACRDCSDWLETYGLLSTCLGASEPSGADHPTSEQLAELALGSDIGDPDLMDHLDSCDGCREAVRLSGAAMAGGAARTRPLTPSNRRFAMLAAAAVVLVALGLGFRLSVGHPTDDYQLSDVSLSGVRRVEAVRNLSASDVTVERGSTVRFRAGESVTLAQGFSVGSGARFSVELGGSEPIDAAEGRN